MRRHHSRRSQSHGTQKTLQVAIEHVEDRCLLAGVVGMAISNNGNVTLTGDSADNEIEVGVHNSDLGYVAGAGGTVIEFDNAIAGTHFFPLETISTIVGDYSGLNGKLTINLGAGDDIATVLGTDGPLEPFVVNGDLDVNLGSGQDNYFHRISYVAGDVNIHGGNGNFSDVIDIHEVVFVSDVEINTGATGPGPDLILVERGHFGSAELRGGSGTTIVGFTDSSTLSGPLEILTGSGNDQVYFGESHAADNLRIDTGSATGTGDFVTIGGRRYRRQPTD